MGAHDRKRRAPPSAAAWIAAIGLLPAAALAETASLEACQFSEAPSSYLVAQASAPTAQRDLPTQTIPREPTRQPASPATELLRAPTEQEFKLLGELLKALADPATSATTLTSLGENRPISFDRYALLLGDVRAILIYLNARELRARLERSGAVKGEARAWIEPRIAIMEACAPARFSDRGGIRAFQRSVELVGKYRQEIQPYAFRVAAPGSVSAPPATVPSPALQTGARP